MLTTNKERVRSSCQLRDDVAKLSSGRYYETKGAFINALTEVLDAHGLQLETWANCPGDEGRATWLLSHDGVEIDTCAFCTWFRMPSGRYEFIIYLT